MTRWRISVSSSSSRLPPTLGHDRLAPIGMKGVIFPNEGAGGEIWRAVAHEDAAGGGEHLGICLNLHDVIPAGDRPKRAKLAIRQVVDRVFLAQAI